MASIEFLDHPADIQMHCTSDTLCGLYETAAEGMTRYAADIRVDREVTGRHEVREGSNEMRLVDLLTHFINLMYGDGLVVTQTRVSFEDGVLVCSYTATTGALCRGLCEIKAVTLCGLRIFEEDGLFHLYCVFDV